MKDSVAENLAVAAAHLQVADVSALNPNALAEDHKKWLDVAVAQVNKGFGPQAQTAVDEGAPLLDSAEAIAYHYGPTGPGRDKQIDADRTHAEALVASRPGTFGTAPNRPVAPPLPAAVEPGIPRGPAAYAPETVAIRRGGR